MTIDALRNPASMRPMRRPTPLLTTSNAGVAAVGLKSREGGILAQTIAACTLSATAGGAYWSIVVAAM